MPAVAKTVPFEEAMRPDAGRRLTPEVDAAARPATAEVMARARRLVEA